MSSILEVFNTHLEGIDIDDYFANQIIRYAVRFRSQGPQYLEFFGGVLLGVQPIRFTPAHRATWFNDVLGVDENDLRKDLSRLAFYNAQTNRVASDTFNLSCCYVLHAIHHSKRIKSEKLRDQAKIAAMQILHYKFICGLVARRYPHNADPSIAIKAYDELTLKSDIKRMNSWNELIDDRCKRIIERGSTHYSRYTTFEPDSTVERFVRDVNNGIRKIINRITDTYYAMYNAGMKITTSKQTVELDDGLVVRDVSRAETIYRQYLFEIIYDKPTFVKKELMDIIIDMHNTASVAQLRDSLEYISDNVEKKTNAGKDVTKLMQLTMEHAIEYITVNKVSMRDMTFLFYMRNVYTSSRTSNAKLLEMRRLGEKVVGSAINSKNTADIAAVRTAVFLYVLLRVFSRNYYVKRARLR